jgi:hypothetical protein
MHLNNCKGLKTGKDLKCPAARLTGPVRPVLSRPFIPLEKMGVSDAWRTNLTFMQKLNLTLLRLHITNESLVSTSEWRCLFLKKSLCQFSLHF